MLAQLLRFMILTQVLLGLGVGYFIYAQGMGSMAWPFGLGLSVPLFCMACSSAYSGWLSRSNGVSALWFKAVAGEFFASVHIFLLRQPWAFKPPVFLPAPQATRTTPVIVVHGYLCNFRIWTDVTKALHQQGFGVMPVNLEPIFTSIDNYAPILEAAVKEACQQTGASKVILVGHSMGGIAIRAWIRVHGTDRVAGVITLGSPHQGTLLSRGALGLNAQQMAWRSPWIKALAASESDAVRRLFKIAITPQDNIVFPQRVQLLSGTHAESFEGIGHLQMCLHRPVIDWVVQQAQDIQKREALP